MNEKISDDLAHIRSMMERSSRFISLSGLSGVGAGIIGLITGVLAHFIISESGGKIDNYYYNDQAVGNLIILGIFALIAAVFSGCFFAYLYFSSILSFLTIDSTLASSE